MSNLSVTIVATVACIVGGASVCQAQLPLAPKAELPSWANPDHMTYASVEHTNIFEVLPSVQLLDHVKTIVSEENVQADNLDPEEASQMATDLVRYAHKFLGTRYRRGGKKPGGFDCSGFTSYIFSQFGYSLNANSGAQFSQGESVQRDEVLPGDLLFFKGRASRSSRIGHVAIAISRDPDNGDITFIHAAIKGGIRVDKVSAPYYAQRFVGARRVIE